jgi:uncharacterized protein
MQVRFDEISPHGGVYEIRELESLCSQTDFVVKGPVDGHCVLRRKGETQVALTGRVAADLVLVCDRCLGSYDFRVDSDFQLLFEVETAESRRLKALDARIDDLDSEVLAEPVIDLDDVVRQQVYLALPMKNLCLETCRGVCAQCGTNLNLAACGCSEEGQGSPFAVLARLKK